MKGITQLRLSILFFFEFFIWGGWFVTMGTFLSQRFNASGKELALAYETQSIGAIIAPFIIGLIADRYFSAQKILGVLHLTGAGYYFTLLQPPHSRIFILLFFFICCFICPL